MSKRIKGITVEIGGDTTGLDKALSGVNKEIRNTQAQLKDVERLLKLDPTNTELLKQKYQLLTRSVGETEQKLDSLKEAEKQVQAQFQRGDIGEDQYNALKREVIETEAKLGRLRNEAKDAAKAVDDIDEKPVKDVAKAAGSAEDALKDAGSEASHFSDYLKADAVVEGVKAITGALKDAAEESKEYRKIMGSLEISSQKAGYTTAQTAEIYKMLYGVLADDQTAATTTANLQALGLSQQQLVQMTNAAIGAWATYGGSIPIDGLAESINETIKVGQVTGTFADVLNWASLEGETFGVKLKANTEANKEWNNAVNDAASAEDYFNLALQECGSGTERANKVMQMLASQGLTQAGKAWQENNKSLVESNQASDEMQKQIAELGETAEPIFTRITECVTSLLKWFNGLSSGGKGVVAAIIAIVAVMAVLTVAINGVSAAAAVLAANPVVLIIVGVVAAIAALIAIIILLVKNWDKVKEAAAKCWDAIVGAFEAAGQWFVDNVVTPIVDFFQGLWDSISGFFVGLWNDITGIFVGAATWFNDNVITPVVDFFRGLWETVSGFFVGLWNSIVDGFHTVIDPWIEIIRRASVLIYNDVILPIQQFFVDLWNGIVDTFVGAATWFDDNVITPVVDFFRGLWESVSGFFVNLWDDIVGIFTSVSDWFAQNVVDPVKNKFTDIWDGIKSGAKSAWDGIKSVFSGIADWFGGVFAAAWQKVKDVFSAGGEIFAGIKDGIVDAFKTVVNAIIGGINKVISVPFNAINAALERIRGISILGVSPFSWVHTFDVPQIPMLAKGGILSQGSAIVGEAGPELLTMQGNRAVVQPLTNQTSNTTNMGGVNIVVYGAPGQDVNALAEIVMDRMETVYQQKGGAFA